MGGTFHSMQGTRRITAKPKLRLAGLLLTTLIGTVLTIWITRVTWERVDVLQRQFSNLKIENYYLGVRVRSDIQRLNDTLFRYRLHGDKDDYELFHNVARELSIWLETNRTNVTTKLEGRFLNQIGVAYDEYVVESTKVLDATPGFLQTKAGAFTASYEKIQTQSQHLIDLCDAFISEQRSVFDDFLEESQNTLTHFQDWLKLSLTLLLTLAATLVVFAYRGMIAPLRHQLTESQAIIARQEKLASLGELAAGVAHEIRNPLTAIKVRLFSLKKALNSAKVDNEDVGVISNEISRLEKIVKDFLEFARPSEPELVSFPAQRLLADVHGLLQPQLEKNAIKLKLESDENLWIHADPYQLKQVLINLIQNSAESIERNGTIILRANSEPTLCSKPHGEFLNLEVVDDGKGISPDVEKRLFDPFFTTKEGGTGLGLPIAARIIEKHGGELYYQSEPKRGTTFSIVLPRINKHEG